MTAIRLKLVPSIILNAPDTLVTVIFLEKGPENASCIACGDIG